MNVDCLHTAHILLHYVCFCLQYIWLVFVFVFCGSGDLIAVLESGVNNCPVVCVALHQDDICCCLTVTFEHLLLLMNGSLW